MLRTICPQENVPPLFSGGKKGVGKVAAVGPEGGGECPASGKRTSWAAAKREGGGGSRHEGKGGANPNPVSKQFKPKTLGGEGDKIFAA